MRWAITLWIVFAVVLGVRMYLNSFEKNVLDELANGPGQLVVDQFFCLRRGCQLRLHSNIHRLLFSFLGFTTFDRLSTLDPIRFGRSMVEVTGLLGDVLPKNWSQAEQAVFLALVMGGNIRGLWSGQSNALIIGLVMVAIAAFAKRIGGVRPFA